jgi:hypothetical protein
VTRLLGTELTRFRVRRGIALLLALAALCTVAAAFFTAWETRPPSASEIATAKAQADIDGSRDDIEADLNKCLADPEFYLGPNATQEQCRASLKAAPKSYLPREPLDLRGTLQGNGLGLALLVAALLIIAASSSTGGDYASGSMTNQVLFAPGRTRLWLAKAAAIATWSAVASTVLLGGFWLAVYLVAVDRDVPHGDAVVNDIAWHLVRAVVFCAAAAVGAFALTTVFRHAVATLGLLFAYSVGGELLATLLPNEDLFLDTGLARWTLGNNVFGWLETRLTYVGGGDDCDLTGSCGREHLAHLDAGLYLLALLLVACVAAVVVLRRREL